MSDQAKEPSQWASESDVLKYINGSTALLSLLYDLDLMPEQVTEDRDKFKMLSVAGHFKGALDAATAEQQKEIEELKRECKLWGQQAEAKSLLEEVPHQHSLSGPPCLPDCARCEWERIKSK